MQAPVVNVVTFEASAPSVIVYADSHSPYINAEDDAYHIAYGTIVYDGVSMVKPVYQDVTVAGITTAQLESSIYVQNAGPITISAVAAGYFDGQTIEIIVLNSNALTVSDAVGLNLGAATRVLGEGDVLILKWSGVTREWYEIGFYNN